MNSPSADLRLTERQREIIERQTGGQPVHPLSASMHATVLGTRAMADEPRVQELLDEIFDSGRTPEEVCGDCPELLPEVRQRWQQMRQVEAELDALFPTPGPSTGAEPPTLWLPGPDLPRIPGYEVEAVLGRGGMGVVYKARHLRLNRRVALKMLAAGAYASPVERARFVREAEAAAALRHANIVQVHDVGDQDGRPYFTMEYVEGGSLAQKLAGTPQPARPAALLLATLAEAVQVAHQGGIVHRDLKPANVLLTADGTPKIADFGLARRLEGGAGLTQSGTAVGTPSYMAPEQAQGQTRALGPAVDVYALGAILYELLTGRPPFRAETAAETTRQVICEEPVPPSRLNPEVPRDLETICLKCLHKEPQRRYATAAALAEDVRRFLRGDAIAARPEGRLERLARAVRRHPTAAVGLTAGLLLAAALVGGGLWVRAARTAAGRAQEQLDRLDQARRDQQFAARLDAIRLNRAALVGGRLDPRFSRAQADREYEAAFREADLGEVGGDAAAVAARVEGSTIKAALVAALDDWAVCATDERRRNWLLDVARRADPDPAGWRNRIRDPRTWDDPAALARLLEQTPVDDESVPLLLALEERLRSAGVDATALLKKVRQARPADFWANFSLALALHRKNPAESVRYFQAAAALRPEAEVAVGNLGCALLKSGQPDEAIDCFQQAVRLAPTNAAAHDNLGVALAGKGRHDAAIQEYRKAIALNPQSAVARTNLGRSLLRLGRGSAALEELREAVRIDPTYAPGHNLLGLALYSRAPSAEAVGHFREAIRLDPELADAHMNLGLALKAAGRLADAVKHQERAVRLEPKNAVYHFNLGLTLKAVNRRSAAVEEYEQALQLDPKLGAAHHSIGVILSENRRLDEAIVRFQRALQVDPTYARAYAALGEALLTQGRLSEARAAIGRCLELLPRTDPARAAAERHLEHCKALVALEGRLPGVLQGSDQPADARECLQFARLCRIKKHYAAAARLADAAFTRAPALAEDVRTHERYDAACAAALAGCGQGEDAARLGAAERTRWRRQARAWLQADLRAWGKKLDGGNAADRLRVQNSLAHWRADPDLAGLREPGALDNLPTDERREWLALWEEVAAVLTRARTSKTEEQ
jgi:serine/threonine-protein kinase